MERGGRRFELTTDPSSKTLKPSEAFETELVLTALRAACRGTLPALIEANCRFKFKSVKNLVKFLKQNWF